MGSFEVPMLELFFVIKRERQLRVFIVKSKHRKL